MISNYWLIDETRQLASLKIMSVDAWRHAGTTNMHFVSSRCLYVERGGGGLQTCQVRKIRRRDQGRCEDFAFGGERLDLLILRRPRLDLPSFGNLESPDRQKAYLAMYPRPRCVWTSLFGCSIVNSNSTCLHTALSMSYCTKSGIVSYNGKNA
jgi:hypothetical protein